MTDKFFNPAFYTALTEQMRTWIMTNILVMDNFVQLPLQILVLLVARSVGELAGRWFRTLFESRIPGLKLTWNRHVLNFVHQVIRFVPLLLSIFILWICIKVMASSGTKTYLMVLVLNLSGAWVVIKIAASVIWDRFWRRLITGAAWLIAALNIVGLLDEVTALLQGVGMTFGNVHLDLMSILKATVLLVVLLKAVRWVSRQMERSLGRYSELTPSSRLMIAKTLNIILIFIVGLVVLNSIGVDLTALAVFSGAIGVGVGFGLQKVVANFVSGIILLSDKSVKPGDVIEIDSVYGWVKQMGGRCISVITQDGKEFLIPNEDLITRHVVNWSYSSNKIRIKADVGVSYISDIHKTMDLIRESVKGLDRILETPEPRCLLMGFGDSSVDLQLRFWIRDPQNGVANIRSKALLRIWDTFKENNIEIPFPQRDVHLDLPDNVRVPERDS